MAKRVSSNDLDLSLSGSQISSARSSKPINKRPASSGGRAAANTASLAKETTSVYKHEPRKRTNSCGNRTPKLNTSKASNSCRSQPVTAAAGIAVSDDFLALFESQGARPKVRNNKTPPVKQFLTSNPTAKSSTAFPGSAESTPRSYRSKKTNSAVSEHTRHSIFRSDSPLSISTAGDGDSTARYTPQSTARSTGSTIADRLRALTPREDNSSPMNNEIDMVRNSSHGLENGSMIHNSVTVSPRAQVSSTRASTSNHKDLNATNNMLPQTSESRKPPKLHLRTMQNSYQNPTYNVNKTPVNEVHPFQSPVSKNQAEDYIKKVNMAASVIQTAFRKFVRKRKALRASEAAMKRLLTQKREDFTQKQEAALQQASYNKEVERQRAREEKARQARKDAIEELNRRRAEDKQRAKEEAALVVAELESSGKVGGTSKRKYVTKSVAQRTKKQTNSPKMNSPRQVVASPRHQDVVTSHIGGGDAGSPASSLQVSTVPNMNGADLSPTSPSHTGTRTTLDDLMSTLKLLEEEENLPPPPEKKFNAWSVDQAEGSNGSQSSSKKLTAASLEQHEQQALTDSKLKNILSFLDDVETGDRLEELDQGVERIEQYSTSRDMPGLLVPTAEELESMEQASAAASEVTNTVLRQRLKIEEKSRSVQMLQKALNQQRELTIRHARETEEEMNQRLDVQKNEYEETVQRHLNFIDQLIDDKKALSEKCEKLVTELKQVDKKYSEKIKQMQETHDRELAKVKEMITTQEKVKRERWIEEKTKKIKDLTVKGLEPEIQRLIGKHKNELKKLKTIHEAEMLQADERAGQRYVSMTEELRDQLAREKETACQRERELAAQRYEKQLQAEEEAYQQARRRLYQEIQDEKERLAQQASRQRQEMDKLQRQLEESHTSSGEVMRREYEKTREEQERRHEAELAEVKERLTIEKEAWEQNYMKKQEAWLLAKEREVKEKVKVERDREIELVIGRLEDDGVQAREECERAAENRIKRIREKYETELDELERSERQAIEKHNQMKAELLEAKGDQQRLKVLNRQKEQEVEDIKRLSEKLHKERDHVQDVVRQEFADKLIATDEENKRVKQEMAEQISRHKLEIERMKQEVEVVNKAKQEEMDAVHTRVKQAIAKKEEVVSQVKQQYQAALKRADHLESLLEQQRKQLLGNRK